MKKKVLVSALVLVLLIGVGTGAYLFYEYKEHKPLILECTINESAIDPSLVGRAYLIKIEPSVYGWSHGPADGLGSRPTYWNDHEEQWDHFEGVRMSGLSGPVLTSDKNKFEWLVSAYKVMRVDRNSGEFSVLVCPSSMELFGRCVDEFRHEQELVFSARGTCAKSAEPARTLKQKF